MTVKNVAELVLLCENVLGWTPASGVPLVRARKALAQRLTNEMRKQPQKLTLRNLELTVELLRRERAPIRSPLFLIHRVDDAIAAANAVPPVTPIAERIEAALAIERAKAEFDDRADHWVDRLIRVRGPYRAEVYAEWHAERGGL